MSTTIRVLYFASLGERLNCQSENFSMDSVEPTLSELKTCLAKRDDIWHLELLKPTVRAAVNQDIVNHDVKLQSGDEVAFFPPVTGG